MGNAPGREEKNDGHYQSDDGENTRKLSIPLDPNEPLPNINNLSLISRNIKPSDSDPVDDWGPGDVVPTVFRWEHGGRKAYISGSFNDWKEVPMHRSGNDFMYIHDLTRKRHTYRFNIDNEWKYAPDQPSVYEDGNICNTIDVSNFVAYTGDDDFVHEHRKKYDSGEYAQTEPDPDEYSKEPPPLPPHLRQHILNKPPPTSDATSLHVPANVSLNHLFCTALKGSITMLGTTQRYKQKYVTTVYYRITPS